MRAELHRHVVLSEVVAWFEEDPHRMLDFGVFRRSQVVPLLPSCLRVGVNTKACAATAAKTPRSQPKARRPQAARARLARPATERSASPVASALPVSSALPVPPAPPAVPVVPSADSTLGAGRRPKRIRPPSRLRTQADPDHVRHGRVPRGLSLSRAQPVGNLQGMPYGPRNTCPVDTLFTLMQVGKLSTQQTTRQQATNQPNPNPNPSPSPNPTPTPTPYHSPNPNPDPNPDPLTLTLTLTLNPNANPNANP